MANPHKEMFLKLIFFALNTYKSNKNMININYLFLVKLIIDIFFNSLFIYKILFYYFYQIQKYFLII